MPMVAKLKAEDFMELIGRACRAMLEDEEKGIRPRLDNGKIRKYAKPKSVEKEVE